MHKIQYFAFWQKKWGRFMPGEAKWAQILGSKYSILANSGFHENDRR